MSEPVIITKLNNLNSKIQDSNFSTNNPSQYGYLDNIKTNILSNYDNSITKSQSLTSNIQNLKTTFDGKIVKIDNISQRKLEISRFYILKYQKEIGLLQKIVITCGIGLAGCLLFNIGIISSSFLSFYLGVVLSVGFIVLFYNLWDIYVRDNQVFDEYEFGVYGTKAPTTVIPENDNKYSDSQLSSLKC